MADEQTTDDITADKKDRGEFDATDTVTIFVPKDDARVAADPIRLNVNGHKAVVAVGRDETLPRYFLPALTDAGVPFRMAGGDAEAGGGAPEGSGVTTVASTDTKSDTTIPNSQAAHGGNSDSVVAETDQTGNSGATGDDGGGGNDDDDLVAGTVDDVTAKIADADDALLDKLLAAEKDREKPRVGVTGAIEAEQKRRKDAAAEV